MNTLKPTPEQQDLIEHSGSNLFVTAVPGAGKTTTMAQRFARLTQKTFCDDRRGVAVLSFTNAAATEIEERARNVGGDLTPPNFIGTIDSFLRRFLVVPYIKSQFNVVPDIRDEWGEFGERAKFRIPNNVFRNSIQYASLAGVNRTTYKPNYDLVQKCGGYLSSNGEKLVTASVSKKIKALNQLGYFDADSTRKVAWHLLENNSHLIDILASRFREVILDEVQDCNATDLLLLDGLHRRGVGLTLIGDLDQDIYGFRGSDAEKVREFCSKRAFESTAITRNFRSTPEICEFVSALRQNNTIKDQPVRESSGVPLKIFSYSKLGTVSDLRDALDSSSNTVEQSTILASTHAVLAEASRSKNRKSAKTITKTKRMITGITMLLDSYSAPSQRKKAINHIERGIVENFNFGNGDEIQNRQMLEDHFAAKGGSLNLVALEIAFAVKDLLKTENPRVAVKDQIEKTLGKWGLSVKARARIVPNANEWDRSFSHARSTPKTNTVTIHGSKGMQYNRVIVVLDKKRAWPNCHNHAENLLTPEEMDELATAQRLLYVAASRARNELVLAVDQGLKENLEHFLSVNAIEVEHVKLPIDH